MDKERILENLAQARMIMKDAPQERINLRWYKNVTPCGTLCCFAGELAGHDYFAKQGMELAQSVSGAPFYLVSRDIGLEGMNYNHEWLDKLFGCYAWPTLFDSYGQGKWDQYILAHWENDGHVMQPPHKQLALLRIQRQEYLVLNELDDLSPAR